MSKKKQAVKLKMLKKFSLKKKILVFGKCFFVFLNDVSFGKNQS